MKTIIYILFTFALLSCNRKSGELDLCGIGVLQPYYFTGLTYKGGTYAIKEQFRTKFTPVLNGENSGIIKIRFDVNCLGETGNFEVNQFSLNYQAITLNDSVSSQLLSIAKQLDGWIPGKNEDNEPVNSFKFLAIKLVDGQITEVLPK